ncbi:MAG TPA: M23 family metallopeptidase [Jiangellaceae bacterium]
MSRSSPTATRSDSPLKRYAPRTSGPAILVGVFIILAGSVLPLGRVGFAGTALIVVGLALYFVRSEDVAGDPVTVRPPVEGRWIAINSPASRVPSHGTRELGQTYAIDLVYHPDPSVTWRGVHRWPPARRPHTFPAFGQPILAPADGVVVAATGWQRDHWSRNSVLGLVYLIPEMLIRGMVSLLSGYFVLGNHVIVDLGDGVFAVFAHLKRGSLHVRRGDRVRAGQQIAECGNSGNTSEPHLHFHLMDHRRPAVAAGVPFSFDRYEIGGQSRSGVPANNDAFTAG